MPTIEQRLDDLEHEVGVLRAEDSIRQTLSQYAVGVDDRRPEILAEIFADDAVLTVPAWNIERTGKDAILEFFSGYWTRFETPHRYYANEVFTVNGLVDGDTASAFMYWHLTQARDGKSYLGWGSYYGRSFGSKWI